MDSIIFYLDENVAHAVADGLRYHNVNVLTTHEADHIGVDDRTQLAFAIKEQRVFVTQDDDLLKLASAGIEHAGIVYYKPQTRSIKQIIQALLLIHGVLSPDEMKNHIEYI